MGCPVSLLRAVSPALSPLLSPASPSTGSVLYLSCVLSGMCGAGRLVVGACSCVSPTSWSQGWAEQGSLTRLWGGGALPHCQLSLSVPSLSSLCLSCTPTHTHTLLLVQMRHLHPSREHRQLPLGTGLSLLLPSATFLCSFSQQD